MYVGILPLFVGFGCFEGKAGVFAETTSRHFRPESPLLWTDM